MTWSKDMVMEQAHRAYYLCRANQLFVSMNGKACPKSQHSYVVKPVSFKEQGKTVGSGVCGIGVSPQGCEAIRVNSTVDGCPEVVIYRYTQGVIQKQ